MKARVVVAIATLALASILFSMCRTNDTGVPTKAASPRSIHSRSPSPLNNGDLGPPAATDPRVAAARRDLQRRYGYDPDEISVSSIEKVTWPNEARGCPQTDRTYEPKPLAGYRITMAWKDIRFKYHGADDDPEPFLCQYLD